MLDRLISVLNKQWPGASTIMFLSAYPSWADSWSVWPFPWLRDEGKPGIPEPTSM